MDTCGVTQDKKQSISKCIPNWKSEQEKSFSSFWMCFRFIMLLRIIFFNLSWKWKIRPLLFSRKQIPWNHKKDTPFLSDMLLYLLALWNSSINITLSESSKVKPETDRNLIYFWVWYVYLLEYLRIHISNKFKRKFETDSLGQI